MQNFLKRKKMNRIPTKDLIMCALFAALTAAGAFIKVPVPFVPFTLQFLFTNLAGLTLGSKRGAAAVGVYIAAGLAGLPVFSAGGGIGYVLQPTFGYIIGFLAGSFLAGLIADRAPQNRFSAKTALTASLVNLLVVYLFGAAYYYFMANYYLSGSGIGVFALLLYCVILAVPGDIALCFLSAAVYKRLIGALNKEFFGYEFCDGIKGKRNGGASGVESAGGEVGARERP
jgi:biotin transport system substrate-specific component